MALARAIDDFQKTQADHAQFIVKDGETIFIGALVAVDTTLGRVVNVSDVAARRVLGFVTEIIPLDTAGGSITGDSAGTGQVGVEIDRIRALDISVTGVTAATDVGKLVYATDENTFTLTPTSNIPAVGFIHRFVSGTTVHVVFFSAEKMAV